MCTNYVPTRGERLSSSLGVQAPADDYPPQAWPGYAAPLVRLDAAGQRECLLACFGLIPAWSRDGRDFRHCYNARRETVASRPSFRDAWRKQQRCIVPADAVFEPCHEPNASGRPVRWRIEAADHAPLGLAGIWSQWQAAGTDQMKFSFSLLTINADEHALMRRFHAANDEKRSVVVLQPEQYADWLAPDCADPTRLLQPFDARIMRAQADPLPSRKPRLGPIARPRARTDTPGLPFIEPDKR